MSIEDYEDMSSFSSSPISTRGWDGADKKCIKCDLFVVEDSITFTCLSFWRRIPKHPHRPIHFSKRSLMGFSLVILIRVAILRIERETLTSPSTQNFKAMGLWVFLLIYCTSHSSPLNVGPLTPLLNSSQSLLKCESSYISNFPSTSKVFYPQVIYPYKLSTYDINCWVPQPTRESQYLTWDMWIQWVPSHESTHI